MDKEAQELFVKIQPLLDGYIGQMFSAMLQKTNLKADVNALQTAQNLVASQVQLCVEAQVRQAKELSTLEDTVNEEIGRAQDLAKHAEEKAERAAEIAAKAENKSSSNKLTWTAMGYSAPSWGNTPTLQVDGNVFKAVAADTLATDPNCGGKFKTLYLSARETICQNAHNPVGGMQVVDSFARQKGENVERLHCTYDPAANADIIDFETPTRRIKLRSSAPDWDWTLEQVLETNYGSDGGVQEHTIVVNESGSDSSATNKKAKGAKKGKKNANSSSK